MSLRETFFRLRLTFGSFSLSSVLRRLTFICVFVRTIVGSAFSRITLGWRNLFRIQV